MLRQYPFYSYRRVCKHSKNNSLKVWCSRIITSYVFKFVKIIFITSAFLLFPTKVLMDVSILKSFLNNQNNINMVYNIYNLVRVWHDNLKFVLWGINLLPTHCFSTLCKTYAFYISIMCLGSLSCLLATHRESYGHFRVQPMLSPIKYVVHYWLQYPDEKH